MSTTLFLSLSNINQKLTNLLHPLCVSWNISNKKWEYSLHPIKKLFPHIFLLSILWLNLSAVASIFVYTTLYSPSIFPLEKVLIAMLMFGIVVPLIVMEEFLLIFYGSELTLLANWASSVLLNLKLFPPPQYRLNILAVMISEILLAIKPKDKRTDVNIFGLHSGFTFLGSVFGGLFWAIVVVIGDIDPLNFFLHALIPVLGEIPIMFYCNWFTKLLRCLVFMYLIECSILSLTTFTLVGSISVQAAHSSIQYLKQMEVSFPSITLYTDIFVGCCLIKNIFRILNCLFLSGAFFALILATNLTIFGTRFIPGYLFISCPFLVFVLIWCVMLILHFESMVNETTREIIQSWKYQVYTTTKRRYLKLVLKSLKPIAIPVGSVGNVDRAIQMNYMNAYLVYVANTSILFQGILNV